MSSDSASSDRTPRGDTGQDLRRLGKYEIVRKLGVGGMGTVYLATDTDLKRMVALKVLPQDRAKNPTLVRRFKSEGQAAALLHHANIVSVYEAGEADGYLFLALEYIEGVDLLEWMNRKGPVPVKRSVEIMRQVAMALQHAYERNIVHRDIKPSNLMISRNGTVKLTDMGLARSIDDTLDTTITRDGTTVGTVDYMAPEQAANSKSADIRSDIYSLGCTWYHLLTGSPPYPQGSITNKISAHISGPIPDPRVLNPQVPEAVVAVIHRMMAKKKDQRYETPAELLADLDSDAVRRGGSPPDLLEMFGDETPAKPSRTVSARKSEGSHDAGFTVHKPGQQAAVRSGGGDSSIQKGRRPTAATKAQETRAELSASGGLDRRAVLVRMAVNQEGEGASGKPGQKIPWGLIVLSLIVVCVSVGIWWAVNTWSEKSAPPSADLPYATGIDPNELPVPLQPAQETPPSLPPAPANGGLTPAIPPVISPPQQN